MTMKFGEALEKLKGGDRVYRGGWNGKGQWLVLVPGDVWSTDNVDDGEGKYEGLPWIMMKTADDKLVPWIASQSDLLSEDWFVSQTKAA